MIRLSKSSITALEKEYVLRALEREYLGMGQEVKLFEEELTSYFGRKAVCVNTGTSALHLAFQAIGLKSGDEVLTPSLTYVATFQAIFATGAKAIPCEVNDSDLLVSIEDMKSKLTSKTKAICLVHYSGNPGPLGEYYNFAKEHGLRVIEDAAHAFGTTYNGDLIGKIGDIVCFSFDGIKNITSGEGGCVVSSDEQALRKISDARLLGVEGDTQKRFTNQRSWSFDVTEQGWRYHMSDIMAALGQAQLKRFPQFQAKRRELAQNYLTLIHKYNLPVSTIKIDYSTVTPHIFIVRVSEGKRDQLKDFLLKNDIQTGIHYQPNHVLTIVKERVGTYALPVTEKIYKELLTLPLHFDLTSVQQETIMIKMKEFFDL